ncbi:MAG: MBL fold metallo-hydrolase [Actinomycetaceae bacterium]|nr:MBL fold metallo-hydrolase [Actinomycetaceae bacterium]
MAIHTNKGFLIVGGPTIVFDFGGLRFLSDPTFDQPTDYGLLQKTEPPAARPEDLGPFDVTLISHDDHKDNLDCTGRTVASTAAVIVSTHQAAKTFGPAAIGLKAGESTTVKGVTIHAIPALHGPADGQVDARGFVNCEVLGFVLRSGDTTLYISGDNTSVENVRSVAERFSPIDYAIMHVGRASVSAKFGGRPLSMSGTKAAQAAQLLGTRQVIAIHQTHWAHFTEGPEHTRHAFEEANMGDILDPTPLGTWGSWR